MSDDGAVLPGYEQQVTPLSKSTLIYEVDAEVPSSLLVKSSLLLVDLASVVELHCLVGAGDKAMNCLSYCVALCQSNLDISSISVPRKDSLKI
jgi:hypothetical protein